MWDVLRYIFTDLIEEQVPDTEKEIRAGSVNSVFNEFLLVRLYFAHTPPMRTLTYNIFFLGYLNPVIYSSEISEKRLFIYK